MANYGEAEAAESRRDFIHKMKVGLKELRESLYWIRLANEMGIGDEKLAGTLIDETDELIRIFYCSARTAEKNGRDPL
jgi:four helix bundle protein